MSDKIYAWLLRLYPSHFRDAYGDEALQLFRDRSRDEKGFLPTLRHWLDLFADLLLSVPREYRYLQPRTVAASFAHRFDGTPSFHVFDQESPRFEALVFGVLLSLLTLATVPLFIIHFGNRREPWPEVLGTYRFRAPDGPTRHGGGTAASQAGIAGLNPDAADRARVINGVIADLKSYYIYPDVVQKISDALLAHQKLGDYDAIAYGAPLANLLTSQLRDVSHDMHLEVVYSRNTLPESSTGPSPERLALYRKALQESNCTFEKVEVLPHNIGYLKLNSFPDLSICRATAVAAMASLNKADAIIFDLRENRGGYPGMVMLIAAYLFDHPQYMYSPREDTTEQSWTQSPVAGNRLADKPVYVLTSARTFSGAEHFSYNLKMLKRATLVGETTGGATDVGTFHRIDDHFGIGIRETRAINPYPEPDWAVIGVQPDVKVNAADALATAQKLAQSRALFSSRGALR